MITVIENGLESPNFRTNSDRNVQLKFKSNSHAPNLHACIIYMRVNIILVCIFAHANANTHGT